MPYSSEVFDPLIVEIVRHVRPARCLDIGAGAGKYARIVRSAAPDAYVVAVEPEADYVTRFALTEAYDEVKCVDAVTLLETAVDDEYDLVCCGDVLEHMRKSAGIDLLNFLVYRTRFIIVLYPERYVQNSVDGYRREAHIAVWSEHDLAAFDHTRVARQEGQCLLVLAGYLPSANRLVEIDEIIARAVY